MKSISKKLQTHWEAIAPLLVISNEQEYDAAVKRLNEFLDEIGTDEEHPLYSLLDTLGTLILAYEEDHYPISETTGKET